MKDKIDAVIEFCYRWPNGNVDVRYRRIDGTEECGKIMYQHDELREKLGEDCPYFYRRAEALLNNVPNAQGCDTTDDASSNVADKQSTPNKDKEGIEVASDSKPIYPSKENGFNRGLGSPYDKVNENLVTSDNNIEVSPVATLGSDSGNSIEQWKDKDLFTLSNELQDTLFIRPYNLAEIESKASRVVWKIQQHKISLEGWEERFRELFKNKHDDEMCSISFATQRTLVNWIEDLLNNVIPLNGASPLLSNQGTEPMLPKSLTEEELRDRFFKECTDTVEYDSWGTLAIKRVVNLTPHDLFNWFKPYLKTQ